MRRARGAAVVVVVVAALVALARARPPAPKGADAPANAFSAARAMPLVERIAERPHPTGSPDHVRVRGVLLDALGALGLDVVVEEGFAPSLPVVGLRNLHVEIPGTGPTGAVLLVAHYDSNHRAPGAGDDAAAVAAIVETLRALGEGPPLRNDLRVLLTDGEEIGLLGAEMFVQDHPWLEDRTVVLNYEARGAAGPSILFQTGPRNGALIEAYARAAPRPAANSLAAAIYRRMPNDTDFTHFLAEGLPGLNFAFIEGYRHYHQPSDLPANLSPASLQDHGQTMLALVRELGNADLRALDAPDMVFTDVLGTWVLRWPVSWVWPLALLAVGLWGLAAVRAHRRGRLRWRAVLRVAAWPFLLALVAAPAGLAVVAGILELVGDLPGPARGTAYDGGVFAALTLGVVVFAWGTAARHARRRGDALLAGATLPWAVLLLASATVLPEASFLFLPTLVTATLVWALGVGDAGRGRVLAAGTCAAVLLAVLAAPLLQRFFVSMTLARAPIVLLPLAVVASLAAALLHADARAPADDVTAPTATPPAAPVESATPRRTP